MRNIELPFSFVKLIFEYSDILSKPNIKHFMSVVSGLLLAKPKKTITSIIRVHGLTEKFYNIHRFFNRYKWNSDQLGLRTLEIIQTVLRLKELTLALDDTLVMKYGKCIYGRAIHYNHSNKPNAPKYIYGHNWVVLGAINYLSLFKKWVCFPFLAKLFIPKEYFTDPTQFNSRIAIAIDMLSKVKEQIALPLILVADGMYAKKDLVIYCIKNNISLISRLRSDAALYRKAPKPKKRARGRPRKYGSRIHLKRLTYNDRKFDTVNVFIYGKEKTVKVRTLTALWKPAGGFIKVFIVKFTSNSSAKGRPASGGKETISYFFSTDLTIPAEKAVKLIAARWSIETAFKDLKEHFGLNDWQVRKEKPVTRSVTISCIVHSLLTLWTYRESQKKQLDLWDSVPWYTQKSSVSSYDMILYFKNKCISTNINKLLAPMSINQQKKMEILKFCGLAA